MPDTTTTVTGNFTDDPEVRCTEAGIARARFRVAVSGRREQEASFVTVIVWRDQAEHVAEELGQACGGRRRPRPGWRGARASSYFPLKGSP